MPRCISVDKVSQQVIIIKNDIKIFNKRRPTHVTHSFNLSIFFEQHNDRLL